MGPEGHHLTYFFFLFLGVVFGFGRHSRKANFLQIWLLLLPNPFKSLLLFVVVLSSSLSKFHIAFSFLFINPFSINLLLFPFSQYFFLILPFPLFVLLLSFKKASQKTPFFKHMLLSFYVVLFFFAL